MTKGKLATGMFVLSCAMAINLYAQQRVEDSSTRRKPVIRRQFVAGGNWQSHRDGLDKRGWQIQMKHFDDDSLSGRIVIVGSRLQQARLEGRVDGTQVYGVLVDDHDSQVGTFTGSIYQNSVSGTYTTADGDTGDWSYEGIESLSH